MAVAEVGAESSGDDIYARFVRIAVEVLSVEAERLTPEARFKEDLDSDSLDLVELSMAVEEEFGFEVPEEALAGIKTVQDVIDLIQKLQQGGS